MVRDPLCTKYGLLLAGRYALLTMNGLRLATYSRFYVRELLFSRRRSDYPQLCTQYLCLVPCTT